MSGRAGWVSLGTGRVAERTEVLRARGSISAGIGGSIGDGAESRSALVWETAGAGGSWSTSRRRPRSSVRSGRAGRSLVRVGTRGRAGMSGWTGTERVSSGTGSGVLREVAVARGLRERGSGRGSFSVGTAVGPACMNERSGREAGRSGGRTATDAAEAGRGGGASGGCGSGRRRTEPVRGTSGRGFGASSSAARGWVVTARVGRGEAGVGSRRSDDSGDPTVVAGSSRAWARAGPARSAGTRPQRWRQPASSGSLNMRARAWACSAHAHAWAADMRRARSRRARRA